MTTCLASIIPTVAKWIRRRFEAQASVFAIDILSNAILSNHLHVILRSRPDVLAKLSTKKSQLVAPRLYPGYRMEEQLAEPFGIDVKALVPIRKIGRVRNEAIGYFFGLMRALAEPIARMANTQDQCTAGFGKVGSKPSESSTMPGLLAFRCT